MKANKKVVILGGGNGLSSLVGGLKKFPVDITAVVVVSDDGSSTGKLREEFNIPAVGDLRRVIASLSETEQLFQDLLNYRFKTNSDLNGHTLGNLLLTALIDVSGSLSPGIEALSKVFNLKGKVLPITQDYVTLMGEMTDGTLIEGEHNITKANKKIKKIFYKEHPTVAQGVIDEIENADLIILSMGSLYTSIIPNLLCDEVKEAIDKSKAEVMYICNMMTQPGETDEYTASKHVQALNEYLGKKKVSKLIANNGKISEEILNKYLVAEQKDPVVIDTDELEKMNVRVILEDLVSLEDGTIKHDPLKLGLVIFSQLTL